MRAKWIWSLLPLSALALLMFSKCGDQTTATATDQQFLNLNDTVQYVGMETCRSCHNNVYETYIRTGMGQSFGRANKEKSAARFTEHTAVYDTVNDLYYHPYWLDDTLFVQEYRLQGTDTSHSFTQRVDYVIGSGQHTNSHLFSSNGFMYQAPITFYTQKKEWDMAPGFEGGFNSRFSRVIGHECMTCHNGLPEFVEGSVNKYQHIPVGIDCERCHGPGSVHVAQKRAGNIIDTSKYTDYTIVNPRNLDKDHQMSLCQRCHLQGVAVLNKGKQWDDFKPGMDLKDVMNVFLPRFKGAENEFIMASQADRLRMSKCYTQTDMTCITCHNPHISVNETPIDHFNSACTNCHAGNEQASSKLLCSEEPAKIAAADNNCSGCHMPKSGSIDIPHISISDHYIRKQYTKVDQNLSMEQIDQIKSFLGLENMTAEHTSDLTKAKAYLKFYENYSKRPYVLDSAVYYLSKLNDVDSTNVDAFVYWAFLANDIERLKQYASAVPLSQINDAWTAYRIGEVEFALQQYLKAERYYAKAVDLMPEYPDFLNKKAAALTAMGKPTEAFKIYEQLIAMEPNYKEAYCNLAYLTMVRGNYRQADTLLTQALTLDPDYSQAYLNRSILYIQLGKKAEARADISRLLQQDPGNAQALQLLQML